VGQGLAKPLEVEMKMGQLRKVTGSENKGLMGGNVCAFCNKTNHQEHSFPVPMSPINALGVGHLYNGHNCDTKSPTKS
jgi:hypothetical protein